MSHPNASPEVLAAGAADAARIASSIRAANSAAAAQFRALSARPGHQFDGRYCLRWCQRALSGFSLRRLWVTGRRSSGLAAPTSGGGE
ncbi:MAG: PE domain-containing protein [Mycobacterium sp.]|uniref:PE domain-containing protein n=1 Tax=Mycobacterium sp. TaxID=1785 RepID=UPI003F99142A